MQSHEQQEESMLKGEERTFEDVQRPRPVGRYIAAVTACLALAGLATMALVGQSPSDHTHFRTAATRNLADPCAPFPHLHLDKVISSNLGGKGPDTSKPEGLIYEAHEMGPGATDDKLEIALHATSEYTPNSAKQNGFNDAYGTVNIKAGTSVDIDIKVKKKHADGSLCSVSLPKVDFTFFDLDTGADGETTEYIKIKGYSKSYLMKHTELIESTTDDGFTMWKASTVGSGADNPTNPLALTNQQKNRAVTLEYKKFSELSMSLGCSAGSSPRYFTFVARPSILCAETTDGAGDNEVETHQEPETETEAPAEGGERCCLVPVLPIVCSDVKEWYTFFCTAT